jgi:hypothetical protein
MAMTVKSTWHGSAVKANERKGAAEGLLLGAEHVRDAAKEITPVSPVEGGKLRDTGTASIDEGTLRAAVSFNTDYAVFVHERMDLSHEHGQAKYLETPLNGAPGKEAFEMVAQAIKSNLGA